jgi:outer membrane protein assembly factor BamB
VLPRFLVGLIVTIGSAAGVRADDWPQWLGPKREPVWAETGLVEKLPTGGPKVLWRHPAGAGYAGPAVAGGKVYYLDRVRKDPTPDTPKGTLPGTERVVCRDAADGKPLWAHEYDCPYVKVGYPFGPRTTPVVEKDRLYTLGTMGDLLCLNPADGKVRWSKNFPKDYAAPAPFWGWSAHLLVDGDKLISLVGGDGQAVVAFDKATGKELWKALNTQEVGYSPPVIVEAGGKRQLIVWLSEAVYGLNPETGAVYWSEKHPADGKPQRPAVTIITPKVVGDKLVVSVFYHGSLVLDLSKEKPAIVWRSKPEKDPNKIPGLNVIMSSILAKDGHLYGLNGMGAVVCQKLDTGEVVWTDNSLLGGKDAFCGTVFWVEAEGRVYGMTDQGDVVILKLSPKGYEEVSRAHVLEPTHAAFGRKTVWTHPSFSDRRMIVKNDKEIVCLSLAKG